MPIEHSSDVSRRAAFLVAKPCVLEDVEADARHAGGGGGRHAFVESPEPRAAEVRPDEIGKGELARLASMSHALNAMVGDLRSADPTT